MNETIKQAIKQSFEAGNTLTTLDGLKLFRTLEMRKFVSMLRAEGMSIQDRWVEKNGKRYKEYFVNKKIDLSKCFDKKPLLLF